MGYGAIQWKTSTNKLQWVERSLRIAIKILKWLDGYGINMEEKPRDRVQWFVLATSCVDFAHPIA